MFIGIVLAFIGFGFTWFKFSALGIPLLLAGWFVSVAGLVVHFLKFFQDMRADPKDLYPPAKQPWER